MNNSTPGARDALGLLLFSAILVGLSGLLVYVDGPVRPDLLITYFGLAGVGMIARRSTRLVLGRIWPDSGASESAE